MATRLNYSPYLKEQFKALDSVNTINPRSQLNNLIKQKKSTKRDRKEMDTKEIDSDEAIESDTDVESFSFRISKEQFSRKKAVKN